jgi:hypothetical protein
MRRRRKGTAGFSLTEALVALAIAAFLGAVLTRFVTGTRLNASKVREEVAMDILSDSLPERLVVQDLKPGRIDGRSGALRWHIDVAPVAYYATALSVSKNKPPGAGIGEGGAPGLTPASSQAGALGSTPASGQAGALDSTSASQQDAVTKSQPAITWSPYHVTAVIDAPSGRSHAIDTIRIVSQRAERRSGQADQR